MSVDFRVRVNDQVCASKGKKLAHSLLHHPGASQDRGPSTKSATRHSTPQLFLMASLPSICLQKILYNAIDPNTSCGGIAQLVERLVRNEKARGSNPLTSTNFSSGEIALRSLKSEAGPDQPKILFYHPCTTYTSSEAYRIQNKPTSAILQISKTAFQNIMRAGARTRQNTSHGS